MPSNIIDGQICNTEPASGRSLPPIPVVPPEEVRQVVRRARKAQGRWAELDWPVRRDHLLRFRDLLVERADEVAETISRETGKPPLESMVHEVLNIADLTHYYATRSQRFLRDRDIHQHLFWPLKRGYVRYEPRGIIGVISPWNYPFALPMGDVIMGLAARNAVVTKPSEWTPRSMLKARELLAAAGIDPDLVPVLPGGGQTGAALLDAGVDMVIFTGSATTGRKIGAACGERLIPYVAELGGKDAAIVLRDADIEDAASRVVHGAFLNSGQTCAAFERVLVHEAIAEPFTDAVVRLTQSLRQGDPLDPDAGPVDVGAMVVPSQVQIVQRHIEDALAKGARALTGGAVHTEGGARFVEPTVLVDVTDDMDCWREETFGPTLPIRTFSDVDEAVAIANDSPYGLSAYVFSSSVGKAEDVANRLEAGAVIVNDFFYHHGAPEAPWGGWKSSGVGRVHNGAEGLRELSESRFVSLPRVGASLPIRFPYGKHQESFWRGVGRLLKSPFSRFL